MNDKKVEGFRLTVEPSGKKRYGTINRSRSRSRDNKRNKSRKRRYVLNNSANLLQVRLLLSRQKVQANQIQSHLHQ